MTSTTLTLAEQNKILRKALSNCVRALENWIDLHPEGKDAIDVIALESASDALAMPDVENACTATNTSKD